MYKYKNKLTVKKGMKRYVARRSRIIRNNRDVDGGMIKCEAYDQITINVYVVTYYPTTSRYKPLHTIVTGKQIGRAHV